MAQVKIEQVRKAYGDNEVLHGVDIDIPHGSFTILVGPSGCGKSTLLRMIAGLEAISGGNIVIGDKVVNDISSPERDIAMVFQNYALYPHLTVAQNMGFSLKVAKVPKAEIEQKVKEAAKMLGLTDYLNRRPQKLSGGNGSASPWGVRLCVTRLCSSLMNRCQTLTPKCEARCGRSYGRCTVVWAQQ